MGRNYIIFSSVTSAMKAQSYLMRYNIKSEIRKSEQSEGGCRFKLLFEADLQYAKDILAGAGIDRLTAGTEAVAGYDIS